MRYLIVTACLIVLSACGGESLPQDIGVGGGTVDNESLPVMVFDQAKFDEAKLD